jgi:hypothetical protein
MAWKIVKKFRDLQRVNILKGLGLFSQLYSNSRKPSIVTFPASKAFGSTGLHHQK